MLWVAGAAGVGILAAILFVSTGNKPASSPVAQAAQKAPQVSTRVQTSAPVQTASVTTPVRQTPAAPADWRVIAYTYTSRKDAEERAKRVQTRWPDLRPEVFSPNRNGGPYLVSLGGVMTRSEALRLKTKARSNGLPRDTFARNFK
jgi:hypothetical protein